MTALGSGLIEARMIVPAAAVTTFELMLADAVLALTSFEIGDGRAWSVEALLAPGGDQGAFAACVAQAAAIAAIPEPDLAWRLVPQNDWVSETQKLLSPLQLGRFWVHGRDHRGAAPAGCLALEIEAGLAFGTGRHATTSLCLDALSDLARQRRHIAGLLDVGCGSGILAMAGARLWPGLVVASDLDPVAVRTARANARINGLSRRLRLAVADGVQAPAIACHAPYEIVVANILAPPLIAMARPLAASVAPGGVLILSGLLVTQEQAVFQAYRAQGLHLRQRYRRLDWAALALQR